MRASVVALLVVLGWVLACSGGSNKPRRGDAKMTDPANKPRKAAPADKKSKRLGRVGPIPYGMAGDIACPPCIGNGPHQKASSTLKGGYVAANVFDEDPSSAWCEGAEGSGIGEWIELSWDKPMIVAGFEFVGGYAKSWDRMEENGRIKQVTVQADGRPVVVATFEDPLKHRKPGAKSNEPLGYGDLYPALWGPEYDEPVKSIRLTIDSVYPGTKYKDTCISQWTVYAVDPEEVD